MKNKECRTSKLNILFDLTSSFSKTYDTKKEKTQTQKVLESHLVAGAGLEPATFGLWARRATYCSIPRYEGQKYKTSPIWQYLFRNHYLCNMHKAGFVNIIGSPNVGKSTLTNAILGEKLAITTAKAQTTRHRILGMRNTEEYQLILSDTPGIIDPAYKLQESMMEAVQAVFADADVLVYMVEIGEKKGKSEDVILRLAINHLFLP